MSAAPASRVPAVDVAAGVLSFLLLNTLLVNVRLPLPVNVYLSDFLVLGLLALAALRAPLLASPPFRPWTVLFGLLAVYYAALAGRAALEEGAHANLIVGQARYLLLYPLVFLAGLAFAGRGGPAAPSFLFVRVHVLLALGLGLLGTWLPALHLARSYRDGRIVATEYYQLVTPETALLCCLLAVHDLAGWASGARGGRETLLTLAACVAGVLGTQNRSVILVLVLMLALLPWSARSAGPEVRRRLGRGLLAALVLSLGVGAAVAASPARARFEARLEATAEAIRGKTPFIHTNPGIRLARAVFTFRRCLEAPLLGHSWGTRMPEIEVRTLRGKYIRSIGGTPHNYYLVLFYSTGLAGLALSALLLGRTLAAIRPRDPLGPGSVPAHALFLFAAGTLVHALANTQLYGHPVFVPAFFFTLGSAVACASRRRPA